MNYEKGQHPNSLANLTNKGRPRSLDVYGEEKVRRVLSVTDTGWKGTFKAIKSLGFKSLSEFLEKLGRGKIVAYHKRGILEISDLLERNQQLEESLKIAIAELEGLKVEVANLERDKQHRLKAIAERMIDLPSVDQNDSEKKSV